MIADMATSIEDPHLFRYSAKVKKVYDADTITVDLDLGFGIVLAGQQIRLYGINAPEVKGPSREAGLASRDYLRSLLDKREVVIRTELDRTEKYGRTLGFVFAAGDDGRWLLANKALLEGGWAEQATYGDKFVGWPTLR